MKVALIPNPPAVSDCVDAVGVGAASVVAELYVKALGKVVENPFAVITTSTTPAACAGTVTVSRLSLEVVSDVPATPPKVTEVVFVRPVPRMVTTKPPLVFPTVELRFQTTGAAWAA